jgi:hypothetical protein
VGAWPRQAEREAPPLVFSTCGHDTRQYDPLGYESRKDRRQNTFSTDPNPAYIFASSVSSHSDIDVTATVAFNMAVD